MAKAKENLAQEEKEDLQVNIKDADDIVCEKCEGNYFVPAFIIKRISPLMSPTGKGMFAPVQLFQCSACKHVNEEFLNF